MTAGFAACTSTSVVAGGGTQGGQLPARAPRISWTRRIGAQLQGPTLGPSLVIMENSRWIDGDGRFSDSPDRDTTWPNRRWDHPWMLS